MSGPPLRYRHARWQYLIYPDSACPRCALCRLPATWTSTSPQLIRPIALCDTDFHRVQKFCRVLEQRTRRGCEEQDVELVYSRVESEKSA